MKKIGFIGDFISFISCCFSLMQLVCLKKRQKNVPGDTFSLVIDARHLALSVAGSWPAGKQQYLDT